MNTFFTLLKTTINVNYGISSLRYYMRKDRKKLIQVVGIAIAALFGFGSVAAFFGAVMFGIFAGGKALGKPEIIITMAFLTSQMVVMIFGIFYIMSSFYFSNDLNILLPLPIKPAHVLGSKLFVVMMNEYLTIIPLLLPALIIYGIGTAQGAVYYLKAAFVLFASPVIPLALCSIFVVILMRFVNFRRSKDLLVVLGSCIGLFFVIGWNFLVQKMPKTSQAEFFENFIAAQSSLIETIGSSFPPSIWITYALTDPGWRGLAYLILFVTTAIVLLIIMAIIGNRVFYKSLLSGQEVTRKRRKMSKAEIGTRSAKVSSPVISLFRKEWKLFLRTPIYAMNGLAGMLIAPILLAMPFVTQKNEMGNLFEILQSSDNRAYVTLGALGIVLYITNINVLASTAVSREGKMFWMSKMIPVSAREQITAKLLHSLTMEMIGMLASILVLAFVIRLPVSSILVLFVLSIMGNLLFVTLNLMIDVRRPKLEWTNPQEAVKQNLNAFFGMLVSTLVAVILGGITVGLALLGVKGWMLYVFVGVVIAVITLPCIAWLFTSAENMYRKIEA